MPYWLRQIPPVTRNLLIINILIWLFCFLIPGFGNWLVEHLGLRFWASDSFNPAQIFTYMFLHDPRNFFHIGFNMFSLWMFGRILEQVWGSRRFFIFYMVCGIGAAFVQEIVWQLTWYHEYISNIAMQNGLTYDTMAAKVAMHPGHFAPGIAEMKNMYVTVGASGAIFGLLLGFGFVFPNMPMYLMFIPIPIKAKYMVIGYGLIELYLSFSGQVPTVAHFAHLGGMLFGLILLLYWRKKGTLRGNSFY